MQWSASFFSAPNAKIFGISFAFGAEKKEADHCIHGADEYILLDQLVECGYIFAEAMKALAEA